MKTDIEFRLLDFVIQNKNVEIEDDSSSDDNSYKPRKDSKQFVIQMFGIDETGKTYSALIDDFQPFFYMSVHDSWKQTDKKKFLSHVKTVIGDYYADSIVECKLIKKKKLYGFTNHKEFKFIYMKFTNTVAMNKVKNMFRLSNYCRD